MTRCLITGVAGFIGSSLADALLTRGFEVIGVDNLSTGALTNLPLSHGRFDFHEGDIRDAALMESLSHEVDVIFHEAAIASVQRSLEDPTGTFDVNVNGTRTLLTAARKAGVRRIIFASSSAVYGDSLGRSSTELDRYNPRSPYAAHKLNCELMLEEAWLDGDIETVCLRYFNVFGPRQSAGSPYSGAIVSFVKAMLTPGGRGPVTIYGDGLQTRDFIYIDDVVCANIAAMQAPARDVAGCTFNVGTGHRHSILETAQTIAQLIGYAGDISHAECRRGEVQHSLADVRRAAEYLGLKSETAFRNGLAQTIAWMLSTATPQPATRPAPQKPQPIRIPAARHATRRNQPTSIAV